MNLCTEPQPVARETTTDPKDVHLYCPWCYPSPQLGDTVTALCGAQRFLGQVHSTGHECRACLALEQQVLAFRGCPNCPD
ncbi:hypothetical protein ACFQV2_00260 [Actinokineospora soli]|uniref:Uncharacterized protein n=1 Tax=Actinokineospora soli TaxID=1048753 RepID=A0ABW2TGF8_9PSEU